MSDILLGAVMGVFLMLFARGVYQMSHQAESACSRTYGTDTREFALCVYEREHKGGE